MYKQFLFNIFGQFLQVHFLICIHSQTLLSQILMKILQDIPVYMYIRGFRNRGFRLLTNFDNFIVFQMSIFKTKVLEDILLSNNLSFYLSITPLQSLCWDLLVEGNPVLLCGQGTSIITVLSIRILRFVGGHHFSIMSTMAVNPVMNR